MTLSPLVLAVLAVCWTLPAVLITVRYGIERAAPARNEAIPERRNMETTRKTIVIEGALTVASGRRSRNDLLHAGSYGDVVRTQARSPKSVDTEQSVAYAEAPVQVRDGDETRLRQCSLCLN